MSRIQPIPNWLWVLISILVVRLVLMATFPLTDNSEPRYAEIARLMAETGDWITPWFEPGIPFWGKPPLAFWMSAISFKLLGYSDFAARLPSWLATVATLYLIYSFARTKFDAKTAQWSVLVYASSFLPFVATGAVLMDAYLTLAVTLCLVSFAKLSDSAKPVWGLLFFCGLALGLLAKGPLAMILVLGVVLPWSLWHRTTKNHMQRLPWVTGGLLFFALSTPWYVLAELKTPGFLQYFIVGEHFQRFIDPGWQGDLYGTAHKRPYGSIWLDWMLAACPWILVAVWQLFQWKKSGGKPLKALSRSSDSRITYLLLWALITPLFFTYSGNILWTYVQPSLPALSILLAYGLSRHQAFGDAKTGWKAAVVLTPIVAVLLASFATIYPEKVRTEKNLIAYYANHAQAGQSLHYMGEKQPFSARYYSREQTKLYSAANPSDMLEQHPLGIYLAVPHQRLNELKNFRHSPVLFKSRNYSLIFMKKTAEQATSLANTNNE